MNYDHECFKWRDGVRVVHHDGRLGRVLPGNLRQLGRAVCIFFFPDTTRAECVDGDELRPLGPIEDRVERTESREERIARRAAMIDRALEIETVKRIYKYDIGWSATEEAGVEVALPAGAKVLSVQMQRGRVTCWALVKPRGSVLPPAVSDHRYRFVHCERRRRIPRHGARRPARLAHLRGRRMTDLGIVIAAVVLGLAGIAIAAIVYDQLWAVAFNQQMLERFPGATVLAFPVGDSPGTRDCMSRAQRLKYAAGRAMNNDGERLVEVCDACCRASCWHGDELCEEARHAGTTMLEGLADGEVES